MINLVVTCEKCLCAWSPMAAGWVGFVKEDEEGMYGFTADPGEMRLCTITLCAACATHSKFGREFLADCGMRMREQREAAEWDGERGVR